MLDNFGANTMTLNFIGLVVAVSTFLGVWLGHVAVRKIEAASPTLWQPMGITLILGISCEIASAAAKNLYLSTALGVIGMTLLWDTIEFVRQQQRIEKGHAPANPSNPRHERILVERSEATTIDWLDRNPRGFVYTTEELENMKAGVK